MPKSIDEQLAENEAQRKKLEEDKAKIERDAAYKQYPKHVTDPSDPTKYTEVNNAKEEAAAVASYAAARASADKKKALEKKIEDLRKQDEKEAAEAAEKAADKAAKEAAAAAKAAGKK